MFFRWERLWSFVSYCSFVWFVGLLLGVFFLPVGSKVKDPIHKKRNTPQTWIFHASSEICTCANEPSFFFWEQKVQNSFGSWQTLAVCWWILFCLTIVFFLFRLDYLSHVATITSLSKHFVVGVEVSTSQCCWPQLWELKGALRIFWRCFMG